MVSRKPLRVHAYFYNNFGNHRRNWTIISMLHIWTAYETGTGTAFLSQLKTLFIHMSLPKMCRGGRKTLLNQPIWTITMYSAWTILWCVMSRSGHVLSHEVSSYGSFSVPRPGPQHDERRLRFFPFPAYPNPYYWYAVDFVCDWSGWSPSTSASFSRRQTGLCHCHYSQSRITVIANKF